MSNKKTSEPKTEPTSQSVEQETKQPADLINPKKVYEVDELLLKNNELKEQLKTLKTNMLKNLVLKYQITDHVDLNQIDWNSTIEMESSLINYCELNGIGYKKPSLKIPQKTNDSPEEENVPKIYF